LITTTQPITETQPEFSFRDYLKVLFRQKTVIAVTLITVCATAFIGLQLKTNIYEAKVKVIVSAEKEVRSPFYRDLYAGRNTEAALTQSEIVKSNPVIERAVTALKLSERPLDYEKSYSSPLKRKLIQLWIQRLNLDQENEKKREALAYRMTVDALKKAIRVEPIRGTNIFTISVRDFSPIAAAVLVNAVSRSYIIFDLEQQLVELMNKYTAKHFLVTQLKDNIKVMEETLGGGPVSNIDALGPATVKIIEQATVPMKPEGIPKPLTMLLAVIMSVFLSVMLAFLFDYMDPTFNSPDEIERALNMSPLGYTPRKKLWDKNLVRDSWKKGGYSQSFGHLADQFCMLRRNKGVNTIVIASTHAHEGTSTIAANLAYSLATKINEKTLLIDANLRNARIHKIYKQPNKMGLCDVLEGKVELNDAVRNIHDKLSVIPAGRTKLNPITLIDSPAMAALMNKARDSYGMVLIDCGHLRGHRDVSALLPHVDGLALVINEHKTRRQVAKNCITKLDQTKLLGFILNHRTFPIPKWLYDSV